MKNYSIAVRLTFGFCCVLALCIASGLLTWQAMRAMDKDSKLIEEAYMPLIAGASGVEGQVAQSVSNMKDFFSLQKEEDFQAGMSSLLKAREYFGGIRELANKNPKLSGLVQTMNELEKYGEGYIVAASKGADLLHSSQAVTAELRTKLDELVIGAIKLQETQQQMVLDMADFDNRNELLTRMTIFTSITNAIAEARQHLLRAMVAENPELTAELPAEMTKIISDFAKFAKMSDQPWHKEQAALLGKLTAECRDLLARHTTDWNQRLALDAERQALGEKLIAAARAMVQEGISHTTNTAAALADSTTAGVRDTLLTTGAALLLALLVAVLLTRSITVPVSHCLNFAESVSGGDLSRTLTLDRTDEMGRLGRALNTMVANLKAKIGEADAHSAEAHEKAQEAMVAVKRAEEATKAAENARREGVLSAARQLEEIVHVVSSASDELSAQIGQSERGASEQSALVSETATAMEQMNATVLDVAKNAATASDASATTRQRAESGADVVRKAVDSIRQVQQQSLALREEMSHLGESAQAISQIMGVISDIADQTNLLALNAAIEAARAGEAGRGFAVVADEVRKLAEKTMISTVDVGNSIRAIQNNAENSMSRMDQAVTTIEQATSLATESGSALGEIVNLMDDTADQVRAIATAAEEQSASSEEIHNSIGKVNTISRETAIAMREATQAVSELSRQSHAMASLIDQMKRS